MFMLLIIGGRDHRRQFIGMPIGYIFRDIKKRPIYLLKEKPVGLIQ